MEARKTPFTIWRFSGVTIPGHKIVARHTEPTEHEHEYQRVIGRCMAYAVEDAILQTKGAQ